MKKFSILFLFSLLCLTIQSQSEITGKITDEFGEAVDGAFVVLEGGGFQLSTFSDPEGFYSLKPLSAGSYDLRFSRVGFKAKSFSSVQVGADRVVFLDVVLLLNESIATLDVIEYRIPLIVKGGVPPAVVYDNKVLEKLPSRNIDDAIAQAPSVYQADAGEPIFVRGARAGSTIYYVDGMRMSDTRGVPISAVDQLSVLTGAIPAKYGDSTGGVIILTTKSYR